jgi:hypothetical protein
MTGHHEVRVFELGKGITTLPSGWKPFAVWNTYPYEGLAVVCRKWVRDEKTTKEEPST